MANIERALGIYARMLGKKLGVNVVFRRGTMTAATDGKTVFVDDAFSGIGSNDQATTLFGLVAHEAMHLRLTDFNVIQQMLDQAKQLKRNVHVLKHIQNTIEDVWGEQRFRHYYPSIWNDILQSMVHMRKRDLYGPPDAKTQRAQPASVFLNWYLAQNLARHYSSLPEFEQDAKAWQKLARKVLGDGLVDRTLAIIPMVDKVSSTAQAFELANQVYALIEQVAQQSPADPASQASQQQSGQPGQSGQSPGQTGQGGGQGGAKASEPGSQQPGSPQQSQAGPQDQAQQILAANADDVREVRSEKGDALRSDENAGQKKRQARGAGANLVCQANLTSTTPYYLDATPAFASMRQSIGAHLSGRLETLLMANTMMDVEYRKSGPRLAGSRLAFIRCARTDIFVQSDCGEDLDTVVDILLDGSGSMREIWDQTLAAGFAIADVLSTYHVPVGLAAYGGDNFTRAHLPSARWSKAARRFARPGTSTPILGAINRSVPELLDHNASRRICIVLTDGEPDGGSAPSSAAAQEARCAGVDVIHVFIGKEGILYEAALKRLGLPILRCADASDSQGLAKAIEGVLAESMAKYLRKAA